MEIKKLIPVVLTILLLTPTLAYAPYPYQVTSGIETYDKTFTRDLSSVTWFKDCNIKANYDSGQCNYLSFAFAVLPKNAISINDAVARGEKVVTDISNVPSLRVVFTPARGMRYAVVTFVFREEKTAIYAADGTFTGNWNTIISIPEEYKLVEEVIGLCKEGEMLRANMCFKAQGICIDQFSTNMCTNDYELWCLSYRDDAEGNPIFECGIYPEYACADRDKNGVCDTVVSVICPDINNNGICDADDTLLQVSCVDANHNGVCDDVEAEGVFCTKEFAPVCCGGVTYPNKCFAEGSGCISYTAGECAPIQIIRQCASASDCPIPGRCLHLQATCIDYICNYVGTCEQCQEVADCPAAPCIGVASQCSAEGLCQYAGKCLTQPQKQDVWTWLANAWQSFWAWVLSFIGWI